MHKQLRTLISAAGACLALTCATSLFGQTSTPGLSPSVAPDMTPQMQNDTGSPGATATPGMTGMTGTTGTSETNSTLVLGSRLMGAQVKDEQNQSLGTISNLVVNPDTGHIRYAVISTGGKKVTVPWNALNPAPNATTGSAPHFTLNTTKDKLAKAPSFNANDLSSLSNRATEEPIFTYYELLWFPDVLTPDEQKSRQGQSNAGGMSSPTPSPFASPR